MEVCAFEAITVNKPIPSSLAFDVVPSPSDDEVPLSNLLSLGIKMKKGVKFEKNGNKIRLITISRKNKNQNLLYFDRVIPPPPLVQLAEGLEYEVEAILDSKFIHNKLYYLVERHY